MKLAQIDNFDETGMRKCSLKSMKMNCWYGRIRFTVLVLFYYVEGIEALSPGAEANMTNNIKTEIPNDTH